MKQKEKASFKTMTAGQLDLKIAEMKQKLAKSLMNGQVKPSKNTRERRTMRMSVAVAQTILTLKRLNEKG